MLSTRTLLAVLTALCGALVISNVLLWRQLTAPTSAPKTTTHALAPVPKAVETQVHEELAPFMGRLQLLTHKLYLSIQADNPELAEFYLYEAGEVVAEIQRAVPEYRGHAIALLIERFLGTAQEDLADALKQQAKKDTLLPHYHKLIDACNGCHLVTKHPFIRIPTSPGDGPYLQSFQKDDPP